MVIESILGNVLVLVFAFVASVLIGPATLGSHIGVTIAFALANAWAAWGAIDNIAVRPVRWCVSSPALTAVQRHLGVLVPLVLLSEPLTIYLVGNDAPSARVVVNAVLALLWGTSLTALITVVRASRQQAREYNAQFESWRTGDPTGVRSAEAE